MPLGALAALAAPSDRAKVAEPRFADTTSLAAASEPQPRRLPVVSFPSSGSSGLLFGRPVSGALASGGPGWRNRTGGREGGLFWGTF